MLNIRLIKLIELRIILSQIRLSPTSIYEVTSPAKRYPQAYENPLWLSRDILLCPATISIHDNIRSESGSLLATIGHFLDDACWD
jgi:hypothetical protein